MERTRFGSESRAKQRGEMGVSVAKRHWVWTRPWKRRIDFLVQGVLFKCEKKVGSINHSSIEKISSVSGKEERKNMSVAKRKSGGKL